MYLLSTQLLTEIFAFTELFFLNIKLLEDIIY